VGVGCDEGFAGEFGGSVNGYGLERGRSPLMWEFCGFAVDGGCGSKN